MAFSCHGCNKTFPDSEEQTGSLGDPKYCSDCYEPDEQDDEEDGPVAAVQKKDRDDDDDSHPWEGVMGPYGSPRTP